jgi:hypothetical protein
LQVVVDRGLERWAAVEPVEELGRDGLVPVPGFIQQVYLAGLVRAGRAPLLDAHDLIPVEHDGATLALDAVALAVPGIRLASGQIAALVSGKAAVSHAHR